MSYATLLNHSIVIAFLDIFGMPITVNNNIIDHNSSCTARERVPLFPLKYCMFIPESKPLYIR